MTSPGPGRAGSLTAGVWAKAFWGWGLHSLTYQLFHTSSASLDMTTYAFPVVWGSTRKMASGGAFSLPVVVYAEIWLRSTDACTYRVVPL